MAKKSGIDMSGTDDLFGAGPTHEPADKEADKPRNKRTRKPKNTETPEPENTGSPEYETYTKYTFPITDGLRSKLDDTLRDVAYHDRCEIPKSLLIRYALDRVLAELSDKGTRPTTLLALAELQETEIKQSRKYNADKGLRELVNRGITE